MDIENLHRATFERWENDNVKDLSSSEIENRMNYLQAYGLYDVDFYDEYRDELKDRGVW